LSSRLPQLSQYVHFSLPFFCFLDAHAAPLTATRACIADTALPETPYTGRTGGGRARTKTEEDDAVRAEENLARSEGYE
jgi:hypothetical protein